MSEGDAPRSDPHLLRDLRRDLDTGPAGLTVSAGRYTLSADPKLDGAAIGGSYISEDLFLALRKEMRAIIDPHTAARMSGTVLAQLQQLCERNRCALPERYDEVRKTIRQFGSAPTGVSAQESQRAVYKVMLHQYGARAVGDWELYSPKPPGYWTQEHCLTSARRYTTATPWRGGEGSAYNVARKNGWLGLCCAHMDRLCRNAWTRDECMASAARYATRPQWRMSEESAYNAARRNRWIEACCAHMPVHAGRRMD